jgi:hypothetical protein
MFTIQLEEVASQVVQVLEGSDARQFAKVLTEYLAAAESEAQSAFVYHVVEPTLELLSNQQKETERGYGRLPKSYIGWLQVVDRYWREHRCSPSFRELANEFGVVHPAAALWRCGRLQAEGLLTWQPGRCRTLAITPKGRAVLKERSNV